MELHIDRALASDRRMDRVPLKEEDRNCAYVGKFVCKELVREIFLLMTCFLCE